MKTYRVRNKVTGEWLGRGRGQYVAKVTDARSFNKPGHAKNSISNLPRPTHRAHMEIVPFEIIPEIEDIDKRAVLADFMEQIGLQTQAQYLRGDF